MATIGDDNALVVTHFSLSSGPNPTVSIEGQCSELSAHSSSITGTMSASSPGVEESIHCVYSEMCLKWSLSKAATSLLCSPNATCL